MARFYFICVCACARVRVCVHMYVEARGQLQVLFLRNHPLFLRQSLLLTWNWLDLVRLDFTLKYLGIFFSFETKAIYLRVALNTFRFYFLYLD